MKKAVLKNNKGQMLIEMLLMMTLLLGAATFVGEQFRQSNFIAGLVSGPWKNLSGMIQNGVWAPPEDGMAQHPLVFNRWSSPIGDRGKE